MSDNPIEDLVNLDKKKLEEAPAAAVNKRQRTDHTDEEDDLRIASFRHDLIMTEIQHIYRLTDGHATKEDVERSARMLEFSNVRQSQHGSLTLEESRFWQILDDLIGIYGELVKKTFVEKK